MSTSVNSNVSSDKPRLFGASSSTRIGMWTDSDERVALFFRDTQHLIDWLEAACDGIDALLPPDPCDGGSVPAGDEPVVAP